MFETITEKLEDIFKKLRQRGRLSEENIASAMKEIRMVLLSLILILTLLFMPEGLAIWVRDRIEVECPRCKLTNMAGRKFCRACRTALHPEKAA